MIDGVYAEIILNSPNFSFTTINNNLKCKFLSDLSFWFDVISKSFHYWRIYERKNRVPHDGNAITRLKKYAYTLQNRIFVTKVQINWKSF